MAPPPLVSYISSSSSDSNNEAPQPAVNAKKRPAPSSDGPSKRKALPPLPASFHDAYTVPSRVSLSDDPTLHGGRTRQVPHVDGRWPTFIYIDWILSPDERKKVSSLLDRFVQNSAGDGDRPDDLRSLLVSDTGAPAALHISLSATLSLSTDEREAFVSDLRRRVASVRLRTIKLKIHLSPTWFHDGTSSSSFLVLPVTCPALAKVLGKCNETARAFGQRELYVVSKSANQLDSSGGDGGGGKVSAGPSRGLETVSEGGKGQFHVSIATKLKDSANSNSTSTSSATSGSAQTIRGSNEKEDSNEDVQMEKLELRVENLKLRIGKTVHSIPFF